MAGGVPGGVQQLADCRPQLSQHLLQHLLLVGRLSIVVYTLISVSVPIGHKSLSFCVNIALLYYK